ncbi:MAG: serine protease [Acidobacteria bacterium]|nr:serine protease [Acidobacteriota bacterium]
MIIDNADIKHMITILSMSVVPIFVENENGHPSDTDRGTGFIVRDQDRYFLVSAAHVLKKALKNQKLFIPMTGRALDPSRLVFAPDPIDIAIYDLGLLWPLPQSLNKAALPLDLLSPLALPQDERLWGPKDQKWLYLISGFPATDDQIHRDARWMTSSCYLYGGVDYGDKIYEELTHLDRDVHLAFQHNDKTEFNEIPPPDGMSGSPVWLAYEEGEDLENHKPFSVIGVFIEYWHNYQAAIAVHISEAVKLISQFSK